MTIKNFFGGAIINYGDTLPADAGTPDGAIFFKTGTSPGLYVFGFTKDTDAGSFGDQSVQGWTLIASSGSSVNADTLDGLDSTAFQLADPGLTSIGSIGANGFVVRTSTDTFTTRTFSAGTGITFTPGAGDGSANIAFSVNQGSLSLSSIGGTLPINKGGTGSSPASVSQGGITYANSSSTMAVTGAGTAPSGSGNSTSYFVLHSNGTSAPAWINALTSLNVSYATSAASASTAVTAGTASSANTLSTARTLNLSGVTATGASFDGSANATINVTAVPASLLTGTVADARITGAYTGITNLTASGTVTAGTFSGSGSLLSALNASNLTSGTVPDARITGAYTGITNLTASGTVTAGTVTSTGNVNGTVLRVGDGSATAPSISFSTDTNTGLYCAPANANTMYVATGGAQRAQFDAGGLGVTGDVSASATVNAAKLRLTNTADASLTSTEHAFQIGLDSTLNLILDANEIQGRNNGAVSSVNINIEGGDVTLGNTTASSTIRLNGTALRTNPAGSATNLEVGWRQIPITSYTSGTLTSEAVGACVPATAAITVPAGVFATGDAVTIFNDTAANITITQGAGLTMYGSSAATGNRTLEARGICTIWFRSASVCKITGEVS